MSKNKFNSLLTEWSKMKGVSTSSAPPKFWVSLGNYVINKIVSGKYNRGIGEGRLAMFAGPSGAGKSFLVGNVVKSCIEEGYGVLVIDSENALDDDFMSAIGVDVDNEHYLYVSLNTIKSCTKVVSGFIKEYRKIRENDEDYPPYIIFVDSLDMLQTDSDVANYEKGETKGDQGQQAKQLKKMLTEFMHDIKNTNLAMVCTKQVYQEQDKIKALRDPWVITSSLKFAFTQILLVTRLLLKDDDTKKFEGIKLKVYGNKTRYTKPFQKASVEVPYDTGMSKYSGLLEVAVAIGVVTQKGAWFTINDTKFQRKNFHEVQDMVIEELMKVEDKIIDVEIEEEEDLSEVITQEEKTKQRKSQKPTQLQ
jgi:recombination protein RecA